MGSLATLVLWHSELPQSVDQGLESLERIKWLTSADAFHGRQWMQFLVANKCAPRVFFPIELQVRDHHVPLVAAVTWR